VLTKFRVFEVKSGAITTQSIDLRKNQLPLPEYGRLNPDLFGRKIPEGVILAWIEPDKEPTKHLLADLRHNKDEFGKWKGEIILVFSNESEKNIFMKTEALLLPKNVSYSIQSTFPVTPPSPGPGKGSLKNLPVVIFANRNGVVNYISEGYRIGIGDELVRLIK
jgi:hypothetical protein